VAHETISAQAAGRLAHLDRLKILLTAGVIAAHAAMSYGAAGTWLYEEDSLSDVTGLVLSVLVGGGVMFVLGLFFLMSGMLTTGPLQRRGPRRFLFSRLVRLGIPVVAYALVVWPVLQWLVDEVQSEAPSLWAFYQYEFSGTRWTSRGTGPMWFVAILLVVTVGWCLWRWRFPASPSVAPAGNSIALVAVAVAVGTFLVRTRFPIDSSQFLDVHVWIWPQSLGLFVLGAIGTERGWISPIPPRVLSRCRWAVLGAVLLLVLLIALSDGPDAFKGGWHWEAAGLAVCEGAISVSVSLLALDWARRHVISHGRFERSLAASAYGAFVAQGPVLVLGALLLRSLDVGGDPAFVILTVVGIVGSFACGWAVVSLGHALAKRRSRQPQAQT
jgi:glucan biosynthesis protein C